jgi:fermentation-respiration switch protein FrsA (DUF1100 family)
MQVGPLSAILTPALLWQLTPRLGITTNDLRPIDHIASVNCPVLVAAGDLDRRTTLDETKQLFAAAIEPQELVIFSGAAHVDLLAYSPEQYTSAVLSFLDQHLISSQTKRAQVQSTMQQDAQPEPVSRGGFAPLSNVNSRAG